MKMKNAKQRLEYLRGELRAERISYDELHELQSLREHIEPGDVELLEAVGVPENEVKHTPGPWTQRPSYHNGEPQGYVVQAGRKVIADLTCSPEDLSVEEANARLIAAAPDLLEALQTIANAGESGELSMATWHEAKRIARAAIAKAQGETVREG